MPEGLQWVFELFDRVSQPAERIASAVEKMEKRLADLEKQVKRTSGESGSDGFKKLVNVWHDVLHTGQILMNFLGSLASAVGSVFDRITSGVGFALDAARFKEDTRIALETMLRSKQEASDLMGRAVDLAARTPLSTEQVMSNIKMMVMAGFGKNDALALEEAVADLGALKGFDRGAMDSFVGYLQKIKSVGYLSRDALMDMTRSGLMPMEPILAQVGKLTGKSMTEVQAALTNNSIGWVTAINAMYNAIGEIGGGKVGNLSEKGSKSLSGLLSTLQSRPQEMFMNLDKTKGLDSFKGFIGNLATLLDPESSFGQRVKSKLVGTFNRAFGAVFDDFSGEDGLKRMEGILDVGLEGIDAFVEGFAQQAGPAFENFMKAIRGDKVAIEEFKADMKAFGIAAGEALKNIETVGRVLLNTFKELADIIRVFNGEAFKGMTATSAANKASEFLLGKDAGKGGFAPQMNLLGGTQVPFTEFLFGKANSWERRAGAAIADFFIDAGQMRDMYPAGEEAGTRLGEGVQSGFEKKNKIQSPSKVFEEYGKQMSAGLELGMSGSESGVQLASIHAKQVISQGGATEGAPVNVSFSIGVGEDSLAKAEKIRELVVSALTGAFEQVAIETGVA